MDKLFKDIFEINFKILFNLKGLCTFFSVCLVISCADKRQGESISPFDMSKSTFNNSSKDRVFVLNTYDSTEIEQKAWFNSTIEENVDKLGDCPLEVDFNLIKVSKLMKTEREFYKFWDDATYKGRKQYFDKWMKDNKYWAYFFLKQAKLCYYTQNPRVKRHLRETLQFVNDNYSYNGRIKSDYDLTEGTWFREIYARNCRLLFDAWEYTHEPLILKIIENDTDKWLAINKPIQHGEFKIFPYSKERGFTEINPNQNLQIGLVFSKLYFEPKSKYYLNEKIKGCALNEIESALSLVESNGFLPLSEKHIHVGDSNYAGLSTSILYELVQIWGRDDWINKLKLIGRWLENSFNEKRPWNTKADGKDYHFDRFKAYNLYSRIPSWYAAGVPSERAKEWMKFVKTKFPGFESKGIFPRWGYLVTIPEEYYVITKREKMFKPLGPKAYVYIDGENIKCNIVGEEICKVFLGDTVLKKIQSMTIDINDVQNISSIKVVDVYGSAYVLNLPGSPTSTRKIEIKIFDQLNPIKDK